MRPFPTMPWTSAAVVGTTAASAALAGVGALRRRRDSAVRADVDATKRRIADVLGQLSAGGGTVAGAPVADWYLARSPRVHDPRVLARDPKMPAAYNDGIAARRSGRVLTTEQEERDPMFALGWWTRMYAEIGFFAGPLPEGRKV